MLPILAACAAMLVRDGLYALLTIAEARGKAVLSGALDALGDVTGFAVTVLGAGAIITQGLTPHTAAIIAAMAVTSFVGTSVFVRLGNRWMPAQSDARSGVSNQGGLP